MWPSLQSKTDTMDSQKNSKFKKKTVPKSFNNYFELPCQVKIPVFPVPVELASVVMSNLKQLPNMTEKSIQYLRILENIKYSDGFEMKITNYLQIFKLMLYLEEIQNNIDIRRFDQLNKTIEKKCNVYKLYIDQLTEDIIRPGVIVEIRDTKTKSKFLLTVINVMKEYIVAKANDRFNQNYSPENQYNIRFRYPNYPIRCSHYALSLIKDNQLTPYLFPEKKATFCKLSGSEVWFNKTVENNPQQKQAVINITSKSSSSAPYILYGPPGTGKTSTVVEAICQIWFNNPSEHILVCTPSNTAADVITKRLLIYINDIYIYRMYSPSKEGSCIDEEILSCSNFVNGQVMMLPKEVVASKQIVICTLCACTRLLVLNLPEKHFSYVFIDEAGQATEPDSLIPFNLLSSTREDRIGRLHGYIVIAGDPKQLGPGIRSKLAEPILGKSMLERLMDCEPYKKNEHDKYNPSYITKLIRNYRSHPMIIRVSNELFYENELEAYGGAETYKAEDWRHLVQPKFPVIFHGVQGNENKDQRSPSVYNADEIKVVIHYVKLLVGQKFKNSIVKQSDIGIVTPFAAQKQKIAQLLNDSNYNKIDVGTVELFQGQEKDIIILSTVRSKTFTHDKRLHIGFLSNEKRFNVALTRAKVLLIVVGNPFILQIDKHWWYFLKFCKMHNACRGIDFNLQRESYNVNTANSLKLKNTKSTNFKDTNLNIVEIDNGVFESSDSSIVDENESPKLSRRTKKSYIDNNSYQHRSPVLLSDIITQKISQLNMEKSTTKKKK